MKSIDDTVKFVNGVATSGDVGGGVINLDLGVLLPTPNDETEKIEMVWAINCRLRMDEVCAKAIIDSLTRVLDRFEQRRAAPSPEKGVTAASANGTGKPN